MSGTTVLVKRCVKCGADVTGHQRMRNSKGEYWCMSCGAKEETAKPASLVNPCPLCKQPVHAANLVRKDGQYVCEACATGGGGRRGSKVSKAVIGGVVLIIGAAIYALVNFVLM